MSAKSYDEQNIFARIMRGELPAAKIYEDEDVFVILDVMPQAPGHTLVLPKAPSRNLLDIRADQLQKLILAVQRIARAVQKAFDAPGVTVMQFNEPAAGQTVFHTHFHVIPRQEGVALKPHSGQMADKDELEKQAFALRAVLGGAA